MSDRVERSQRDSEDQRHRSPETNHEALLKFFAHKWKGKEKGPKYLRVHVALGAQGINPKKEIVHQEEFKDTDPPPTKEQLVALTNEFVSACQDHADTLGRELGFIFYAIHPAKGTEPYGSKFMKFRPSQNALMRAADENGQLAAEGLYGAPAIVDASKRDLLMSDHRDLTQENNSHVRFVLDKNHEWTAQLFAMMFATIQGYQQRDRERDELQLKFIQAKEELASKNHERELEKDNHELYMQLAQGGLSIAAQFLPDMLKKKELPQAPDGAPPEPIAANEITGRLGAFMASLTKDQHIACFGTVDLEGQYVPGILTFTQSQIFTAVANLQIPVTSLDLLVPGGKYAITMPQVVKIQQTLPPDRLQELVELMNKVQARGATAPPPAPEPQPEAP